MILDKKFVFNYNCNLFLDILLINKNKLLFFNDLLFNI